MARLSQKRRFRRSSRKFVTVLHTYHAHTCLIAFGAIVAWFLLALTLSIHQALGSSLPTDLSFAADERGVLWTRAVSFLNEFHHESVPADGARRELHLSASQASSHLHALSNNEPDLLMSQPGSEITYTADSMLPLLDREWVDDNVINAGLDWIARYLPANSHVAFANSQLLGVLDSARRVHNMPEFPAARMRLAADIQSGAIRTLEIPVFVNGNHWAGIHINLDNFTYYYRDGLHPNAQPLAQHLSDLQWMLDSLLPGTSRRLTLDRQAPPMPRQYDDVSCGVLYLSMLAHELLGDEAWQQSTADLSRMVWFNRLMVCHSYHRLLIHLLIDTLLSPPRSLHLPPRCRALLSTVNWIQLAAFWRSWMTTTRSPAPIQIYTLHFLVLVATLPYHLRHRLLRPTGLSSTMMLVAAASLSSISLQTTLTTSTTPSTTSTIPLTSFWISISALVQLQ